jgi:hypothetical protein
MKTIDRITIDFIPQSEQRYDTCGDWYYEGSTLVLRISKTPDQRHQQLVAIHELVEALLCNVDGVTQEAVDAFDNGPGKDLDEPGDYPSAPYFHQHVAATFVEGFIARKMDVDWEEYEQAVSDHGVREG